MTLSGAREKEGEKGSARLAVKEMAQKKWSKRERGRKGECETCRERDGAKRETHKLLHPLSRLPGFSHQMKTPSSG